METGKSKIQILFHTRRKMIFRSFPCRGDAEMSFRKSQIDSLTFYLFKKVLRSCTGGLPCRGGGGQGIVRFGKPGVWELVTPFPVSELGVMSLKTGTVRTRELGRRFRVQVPQS